MSKPPKAEKPTEPAEIPVTEAGEIISELDPGEQHPAEPIEVPTPPAPAEGAFDNAPDVPPVSSPSRAFVGYTPGA